MVSVGVSEFGSTEIRFIEPGVNVNGAYYCINLLAQKLLQDIFWVSQGGFFVFQHDGTSSTRHRRFPGAKGATLHFTNTVATDALNSPDLNPVVYNIWQGLF